jgi:hypothetical protein
MLNNFQQSRLVVRIQWYEHAKVLNPEFGVIVDYVYHK